MGKSSVRIEPGLLDRVKHYLASQGDGRPPSDEQSQAWREFYSHVDPLIRRFARVLVSVNDDVDDCAQEVWVKLVEQLGRFEYDPSRGAFSSWLYRIVRDTTVNHFRKERRFRRSTRDREQLARYGARADFDPVMAMEQSGSDARASQMLLVIRRHVSRENYDLLRMRWLKRDSVEHVADALNITNEQVWYREHRARKKLRKVFEELAEV